MNKGKLIQKTGGMIWLGKPGLEKLFEPEKEAAGIAEPVTDSEPCEPDVPQKRTPEVASFYHSTVKPLYHIWKKAIKLVPFFKPVM